MASIRDRAAEHGTGPAWDPPQPRNVSVRWSGSRAVSKPPSEGLQRLLVLPDPQVHYRLVATSKRSWELDPFHDLRAMATAVAVARYVRPDEIVMVGDGMDLPQFGKYVQESAAAEGFNAALEDMHAWLVALAELAHVSYLEGNHDQRILTWALTNARAAWGIKRAVDTHDSWPVMSVPFLLSLDELGVDYVYGYPTNRVDYGRNLRAVHGAKIKPEGIHADEGSSRSVVHGHLHRVAYKHFRHQGVDGPVESWVGTPGCLCRIDSAVPGVASAQDPRTRRPTDKAQNWHQGVAVVTYDPDGQMVPIWEHIPITDGVARWRDSVVAGDVVIEPDRSPDFS